MSFIVVAYPELAHDDFNWIQKYREQNDLRFFSVIDPHITLVFAVNDVDRDTFISEIDRCIVDVEQFDVVFNVATINQNNDGTYFHEFIVPDIGYSKIVKLHDKLYSGILAPYQRFDIDFIPHIGIGNSNASSISKMRIDELNSTGFSIAGRVKTIDIIYYDDNAVTPIKKYELQ